MNYFKLENKIIDFLVPTSAIMAIIVAALFLLSPFLAIKFLLKRKLTWRIILLCVMVSFGIYQAEKMIAWEIGEWILEKMGEGFLHTF